MEPSLEMISRIAKDSFDLKNEINTALMEQHSILVILNHYILTFDMIFLYSS